MAEGFTERQQEALGDKPKIQNKAIPQAVANRMARRVAIATGIPTMMGMAIFVVSYFLISRNILNIPPWVTLLSSGGCFLLGLVGLSYGIFSSSWLEKPGSFLGFEQIQPNIKRLRSGANSPEKPPR
jgi:hypothetical protein